MLERNYRRPWGEADIVAADPRGPRVIIEVRSRGGAGTNLAALESIDERKQGQLRRLARGMIAEAGEPFDLRIDVITVGAGESGRPEVLSHVVNAVEDS